MTPLPLLNAARLARSAFLTAGAVAALATEAGARGALTASALPDQSGTPAPARRPAEATTRSTAGSTARGTAAGPRRSTARRPPQQGAAATSPKPRKPRPTWPVKGPDPLPGALLPTRRIIAFYGNPLSKRMGILGEIAPDDMLAKLDREVAAWTRADSTTPAVPALHLIATVAQAGAGADGKYRARMSTELIERVYGWAQRRGALLFLDVQVGKSNLRAELPPLAPFLARPDVHLGIDPEFSMKTNHAPGKKIGTMDADDVNYASEFLQDLVTTHRLPPKVLVVHRFTRPMLTNYRKITLDPRVQVVIQMDGWGSPDLKRGSYQAYVYEEPVQFTGFKLFYKNDVRRQGWTLMKPADVLALNPRPGYIQYQ